MNITFIFIFNMKTAKGKSSSKMNAVKHWLTSNAMITDEEKIIFNNAKDELDRFFKPKWIIEEMLIENIAFYFVKLQRTINIEAMQVVLQWMENEINYLNETMPNQEYFLELDLCEVENEERNEKLEKIWDIKDNMLKIQSGIISNDWIESLIKIQRYHTSIENRLYKAIKQFYEIRKTWI